MTEGRDYNGVGDWSAEAILARYQALARTLKVASPRLLKLKEVGLGSNRRVYPLMHEVIGGIKAGDRACIELGVQFIESGPPQPFGKILHSNTARALRRAELRPDQVERLRARILRMLERSHVPREFSDYAKLLRRTGLGAEWPRVRARVDETNPHVMSHVRYFEAVVSNDPALRPRLAPGKGRRS